MHGRMSHLVETVSPGGKIGSVPDPGGASASFDATYMDYDGSKFIRILNPCTSSQNMNDTSCQWFDNPAVLSMQRKRWYSAAESLPDESVVLIGGFVNGGYVNRNMPNVDPAYESGTPLRVLRSLLSSSILPAVVLQQSAVHDHYLWSQLVRPYVSHAVRQNVCAG